MENNKIAIVIPCVRDFYFTPQRAAHLGPVLLHDILVQQGIVCRIFNGCAGRGKKEALPREIAYLQNYVGRDDFFKNFYRFGVLPEHLAEEVVDFQPDVVFVSSFAYCYAAEAFEIVAKLRSAGCLSPIFLGGSGATSYPEYYVRHSEADFVFEGEADGMIAHLHHDPRSIAGVWYRENGMIKRTAAPHFQEAARPVLVFRGKVRGTNFFSAMFTRGCPMKCGFCSSKILSPGFRKPPLDDIKKIFSEFVWPEHAHLNIEDDAIVWDFEYLLEIVKMYHAYAGEAATFTMENGIDYRALNTEKLYALARMGLSKLNVALVSAHASLEGMHGRITATEKFEKVVEAAASRGIPVTAYIIVGLPNERAETAWKDLAYLAKLPVLIGISPFYPVPGITGYEDKTIFDSIPPRLCAGTSFYPWHNSSTEELVEIFCEARRINLAKREGEEG